jgi:hypothetical protein
MFRRKSITKGLAAGAIGGLVGTIVMTQFQNAWQKASQSGAGQEPPQANETTLTDRGEELWRKETGTEGAARTAKVYSVRQSGGEEESRGKEKADEDATAKVAAAVAKVGGKRLSRGQKHKAGTLVHYGFGTLMGAVYGMVAELAPPKVRKNTVLSGIGFGAALFAGADEVALPVLRLSQPPSETPASQHLYGLVSHLVYGTTAAALCKAARTAL